MYTKSDNGSKKEKNNSKKKEKTSILRNPAVDGYSNYSKICRKKMDMTFRYKGRRQAPSTRIRAIALLISIYNIPAFFTGCSSDRDMSEEQCRYSVTLKTVSATGDKGSGDASRIVHSDIFIFNDDGLKRLDSYQRSSGDGPVKVASRTGRKIMAVIANSSLSPREWRKINSLEARK